MTYDELYDHVVNYVAMPHTTITEHDKRRACLILGAFMEFIMDCTDAGRFSATSVILLSR